MATRRRVSRAPLAFLLAILAPLASAAQEPALPKWMQVASRLSGEDAAPLYAGRLRAKFAGMSSDPAWVQRWLADPQMFKVRERDVPLRIEEDGGRTIWRFFAKPADRWPQSAYRLHRVDGQYYRVEVDVYCGPSEEACAPLLQELAALRAPAPDFKDPAYMHWMEIVLGETCTSPLASDLKPPRYGPEELRRGIAGTVEIRGIYNRCGEVRNALVHTSSGNRNLDKAALVAAMRWTLPASMTGDKMGTFGAKLAFVPNLQGQALDTARTRLEAIWRNNPTSR